jgi:hypothetical protein
LGNKADIRTGNKKRRRQDALYGLINYKDDNAFLKHLSAPLGLKTQDVFSGLFAVLRISPVIVLYLYCTVLCHSNTLWYMVEKRWSGPGNMAQNYQSTKKITTSRKQQTKEGQQKNHKNATDIRL